MTPPGNRDSRGHHHLLRQHHHQNGQHRHQESQPHEEEALVAEGGPPTRDLLDLVEVQDKEIQILRELLAKETEKSRALQVRGGRGCLGSILL